MGEVVHNKIYEIPVTADCDVFVGGGGIAGAAAALAAARQGAKVILAEKQCILGGLATSGLVVIYLPLCDGMGNQLSYGIAEEFLHLSILHGAQDKYPSAWLEKSEKEERQKQRFEVQFNPVYFAIELEKILRQEGVRILYDTRICNVCTTGNRVSAVILENQDGCTAITMKAAVDATGNAFLFQKAGEETRRHEKGNPLVGWYYSSTNEGLKLHMLGFADAAEGTERDTEKPLISRRFWGDTAEEISEYLELSHQATLQDALKKVAGHIIKEPAAMAHMPQYRMTQCLKSRIKMTEESNGVSQEDSIGMVGDWRKRGPRFEVPFGALYGAKIENLFAAGRCVSADDGMWDVMRVIPACAVTGQAAGTAAALQPAQGVVPIRILQKALRKAGQKLCFSEI